MGVEVPRSQEGVSEAVREKGNQKKSIAGRSLQTGSAIKNVGRSI